MSILEGWLCPAVSYGRNPLLDLHFVEAKPSVFHNGKFLVSEGTRLNKKPGWMGFFYCSV
jgi:hypothetical protein